MTNQSNNPEPTTTPAETARLLIGLIAKPTTPAPFPEWRYDDDWIDVPNSELPPSMRRPQ